MAFQRPIQRPTRRAATPPPIATTLAQSRKPQHVQESQEWILFSPPPLSDQGVQQGTNAANCTVTPVTPHTLPKSRLSDLGSLESAPVSAQRGKQQHDQEEDQECDQSSEADSLDEGLHAFNEPTSTSNPSAHQCVDSSIADALLPAHDGLGAFVGSSGLAQQQLWQHERYNPWRAPQIHTTSHPTDVQTKLDALNAKEHAASPKDPAEERNLRIEKWRLDQSKAIVDEIERQTRRRRRKSKLSQAALTQRETPMAHAFEETADPSELDRSHADSQSRPASGEWSLWSTTRKVIRNLIGMDDATLSYIFGEVETSTDLPTESAVVTQPRSASEMVAYAEKTIPDNLRVMSAPNSWESGLISRLARELGSLVHQLSEHPPGAFSAYMKVQETVPYAGLPTPSELSTPAGFLHFSSSSISSRPIRPLKHRRRTSTAQMDHSLFGIIEEEPAEDGTVVTQEHDMAPQAGRSQADDASYPTQEKAYWEQDLGANMIFSYIKSRLRRRSSHGGARPMTMSSGHVSTPSFSTAATSGPDALRRAALIRHHHPLVSRNLDALRVSSHLNLSPQARQAMTPISPVLGRRPSSLVDDGASSCASQSTKRSKTRHSGSLSITSSRNYWDIGGPSWGQV